MSESASSLDGAVLPRARRVRVACMLFLLCAFFASAFSAAQAPAPQKLWEPPGSIAPASLSKPNGANDLIATLRIGDTTVALEQTPLASLQSVFGGLIGHRGDAGASLSWLCLGGSNSGHPWVLWLESNELDGDAVGGFFWEALPPNRKLDSRCGQVRGAGDEVQLPVPVQPGMRASDLRRALGSPAASAGTHLEFVHEREESLHGESYTVTNSVSVLLRQGIVNAIEVWRTSVS